MITDIDEYFVNGCGRCERYTTPDCVTRRWESGLKKLRQICRDLKLVEKVKWAHPCYMHGDRNIVLIGAVRNDFRLIFFNAALMNDQEGILERQGPNTQHPDMIRFTENGQVGEMEVVITCYIREAMGYAEAGIKPKQAQSELDLPDELIEALDADTELAEASHKLTPGRKRSYVINLSSAKKPETRIARIAKFRSKILLGKGANEK
ncbi:YdeI/OmpD-associated family protein [Microbulbifer sp. SA54]|uniref:YdeI/OmpD-associated family protein n=1 Tax=Microbulbifer sp. SA54 TaxID=3401577 RepID=UPI003AAC9541